LALRDCDFTKQNNHKNNKNQSAYIPAEHTNKHHDGEEFSYVQPHLYMAI